MKAGQLEQALAEFLATLEYPENLGESKHPVFTSEASSFYYLGLAYEGLYQIRLSRVHSAVEIQALILLLMYSTYQDLVLEDELKAVEFYRKAALEENKADPQRLYYQGLAWLQLADTSKARQLSDTLMEIGQVKLQGRLK